MRETSKPGQETPGDYVGEGEIPQSIRKAVV